MKTPILVTALLSSATAFPALLWSRQESDNEGILADEAYLEAALATDEVLMNGTLPEIGPAAQFIPKHRVRAYPFDVNTWLKTHPQITQGCNARVATSYIQSIFEADWMQNHPGKHTAPKNKCRCAH